MDYCLGEPDGSATMWTVDGGPEVGGIDVDRDGLLDDMNRPLQGVVHIKVDNEEIVQRLMARGRSDDNEETIRNRLKVYQEQTQPLVKFYEDKGLLTAVAGVGEIDDIYARIKAALPAG